MSQYASAGVSPRSFLIAGVSAAIVGAAAVTPVSVPAFSPAKIASAVEMASITTPLEVAIKNTYNFVEPWAAYGAAWGQYVLGLIPGLWWVAPGVPFAYYTAEPLVQAGVYTFADVVGLNFAQIGPDINAGITGSINNGVAYGAAWLNSLVPFPPVPPIPPLPGASVAAGAAALPAAATDQLAAPEASSVTTPIEDAIKNTYNFVEPWAAYGAELTQYVLGFIPGLWWIAPGIDLAYFTIEPLVQAGVYTFADVIGLDFAQIGPDISTGVQTSINNAITYGLAWLNSLVPLPPLPPFPPLPGAAVDAGTVSVPAAAAVQTAALEAEATIAGTSEAPAEKVTPVVDAATAETEPVTEAAPVTQAEPVNDAEIEAPAAPAEDAPPAADAAAPAVEAPAVEAEAEVEAVEAVEATIAIEADAETEVAAEVSEPAEAPGLDDPATETAAPADSPTASGADASDNTERPSRATRSATRG
jgi:hypothetical protein